MGQSTAGTALTTTAAAGQRRVAFRLICDWAESGFGNEAGWTDESGYVLSARGSLEGADYRSGMGAVGKGVAGVCYVTVRNPDAGAPYSGLRFSPSNEDGPLYASIGGQAWFMKRAVFEIGFYSGATPQRLRQVTGYIVNWQEDTKARTVTLEVRDRAAAASLTRTSTPLYRDVTAKTYLQTLVQLLGRDPISVGDQVFDDGIMPIPFAWCDDETLWDEMSIVAEAQLGRIWFDKDGDLHFDDGSHWAKAGANSWDDPLTSQAAFTVADFSSCNPTYDVKNVWNDIVVEYQPRYVGVTQAVYTCSETIAVPPGGTREIDAEYRYPVYATLPPAADEDYVAVNAGGTDITDDVTVTVGAGASKATLTVANANASYGAYLVKLQVSGYPVLSQHAIKYQAEDAVTLARFRRTRKVENPYIQTWEHARLVGDFLLSRFKDAILCISLRGVRGIPWLEPGDRVTVTEERTGIDTDFFIGKLDWTWSPASGYSMTLELMRCSDIFDATLFPYFILGTSKYGTDAGHGHLFW